MAKQEQERTQDGDSGREEDALEVPLPKRRREFKRVYDTLYVILKIYITVSKNSEFN